MVMNRYNNNHNNMNGESPAVCSPPSGQSCLEWARRYLNACVCSRRQEASFALGLMSVFCWGVAEVPQIVTNFREGSTEGVSLLFLITWVVGDVFNLAGCYLEPSTLPTQFYMALLYTITTLVLVGQVMYYDHISKKAQRKETLRWERDMQRDGAVAESEPTEFQAKEPSKPTQIIAGVGAPLLATQVSSPIAYARSGSPPFVPGRDGLYYTSARSLASSRTPTAGSYLAVSRGSGGHGTTVYSLLNVGNNSLDEPGYNSSHIPISISTSRSAPGLATVGSPVLRGIFTFAMCISGLNIGRTFKSNLYSGEASISHGSPNIFLGRKLFQTFGEMNEMGGTAGVWCGWSMAVIYMGGRLPQIYLNIKRGSVEGLNPLMFTFAVLGNATYVGSILVNSTEWMKIKSNMPWLVDAGVCVLLDFFVSFQSSKLFFVVVKGSGKIKLLSKVCMGETNATWAFKMRGSSFHLSSLILNHVKKILCQFLYYYLRKPRYHKEAVTGDYKYLE